MEHKNNCVVCGKELVYDTTGTRAECFYCKEVCLTDVLCAGGHYVCDRCHSLKGLDLIERVATAGSISDPIEAAITLMRHPEIKMHGPEHHFLVPAVLLAAYHSATGDTERLAEHIKTARQRAEHVLGGFCGFYGDCGAAVGTGIALSVLTGATPLSKNEWRLCNLMTAKSLLTIALHGGPRCCKRNSFLAIIEAKAFLKEHLGVNVPGTAAPRCTFTALNKECLSAECPFHGHP